MPQIPPYSSEYKSEALRLVRTSDRTVPQLAKELGVSEGSLRNGSEQQFPFARGYMCATFVA